MGQGNPKWTKEEVLLGLATFKRLRSRGAQPTSDAPEVEALSQELTERAEHPDAKRAANFRNPAGVARRLRNFSMLERGQTAGVPRVYAEVWGEEA